MSVSVALVMLVLVMCWDISAHGSSILDDYGRALAKRESTKSQCPEQVDTGTMDLDAEGLEGLEMRLNLGALTVAGSSGDRVLVSYKTRVRARTAEQAAEYAKQVRPTFDPAASPGTGLLAFLEPELRPTYVCEATVDVEVQLPARLALVVDTYGPVVVHDMAGTVSLTVSLTVDGSSEVSGIRGDVSVVLRHGSLELRDVLGSVSIESATSSGQVIAVRNVSGDLDLNLLGDIVRIANVTGALRGAVHGGILHATDLKQAADLELGRTTTQLERVDGPISLRGYFGTVVIDGLRSECSLDFDRTDVRLVLADDVGGFDVDVKTLSSPVACEFPLTKQQEASDAVGLSGKIGGGEHLIQADLRHCSLTIERAGPR